ncbi:MAG: hypothetical protein ACRD2L_02965 [Terriglobia bacterium]
MNEQDMLDTLNESAIEIADLRAQLKRAEEKRDAIRTGCRIIQERTIKILQDFGLCPETSTGGHTVDAALVTAYRLNAALGRGPEARDITVTVATAQEEAKRLREALKWSKALYSGWVSLLQDLPPDENGLRPGEWGKLLADLRGAVKVAEDALLFPPEPEDPLFD